MNQTSRASSPKPPYKDFTSADVQKSAFSGIVWFPTAVLRFVEREIPTPSSETVARTARILQQQWETRTVRNANTAKNIHNPSYTQWRDVPLEKE